MNVENSSADLGDMKSPKGPNTSLRWVWLPLACIAFLLTLAGAVVLRSTNSDARLMPSVVVIDPFAIQHAKNIELQQHGTQMDKVMELTEAFSDDFNKVLDDYRSAGIIVLNKNAVVASPPSLDVTVVVARRLGLTIERQ